MIRANSVFRTWICASYAAKSALFVSHFVILTGWRRGGFRLGPLSRFAPTRNDYEANSVDKSAQVPHAGHIARDAADHRGDLNMRGGKYTGPRPFELAGGRQPDQL